MDGSLQEVTSCLVLSWTYVELCHLSVMAQLISVVCRHSMAHITSVSKADPPFCKCTNTNLHTLTHMHTCTHIPGCTRVEGDNATQSENVSSTDNRKRRDLEDFVS